MKDEFSGVIVIEFCWIKVKNSMKKKLMVKNVMQQKE